MEKDIQKDNPIEVIQKRFNNIVAALYLVTNHLSDMEPLKTGMRETAHIVLEELLDMSDISGIFLDSRLGHIRNLLKISTIANLISAQNVSLLDNELSSIQTYLKDTYKKNSNVAFDISEILSINSTHQFSEVSNSGSGNFNSRLGSGIDEGKGFNLKNSGTINGPKSTLSGSISPANPKNAHISKNRLSIYSDSINAGPVDKPAQQPVARRDPVRDGFSPRQTQIMKEIRTMGQLTIRDLIGKIEGCSEKTIQRELLSLVEVGVIKKEGERRWSRYSMV